MPHTLAEREEARTPEAEPHRPAEPTSGEIDNGKVDAALARIRKAVAEKKDPSDADIRLAQKALGNARVAEMLQGEHLPAAPGVAAEGDYKLVIYARHRFANGPFDTGHIFIGLEGPGLDHTYGFHPAHGGPGALKPGGVKSVVKVDKDQVTKGVRMLEIPVTKAQWEKAEALAKKIAGAPPKYDFYVYNCAHFIQDVANAAGASVPMGSFAGIADPEGTADWIDDHSKSTGAGSGGGGGGGGTW